MKLHRHLIDQLAGRPLSIDDVLEALDREDHREVQPDGRVRVWGWVDRIGKYVRVVVEADGETILTAFPDRNYETEVQSMTIKYYSDVDMLNIKLVEPPYDYSEGQEADPDIVLHFDTANRLLEIEIEHASKRVNLEQLRKLAFFKEVKPEGEMATVGKDHLRSQDHATGQGGALRGRSGSRKPSRV